MANRPKSDPVAGFLEAQRFTHDEVFSEPCPVPAEPGAYGWWFDVVPGDVDVSGCEQRDGLTLLYVGISPTPPPANGKKPASQDLRKRVRYHFGGGGGTAEGSTLRKSLGVLLADELGIELRRIGSGQRRTFAGGEAVLSQWMAEHTSVSWVVRNEPWHLEHKLISAITLPLNPNADAFAPGLKAMRGAAMAKANKLRVLKEW
jgi:hypothetical protein